MSAEASPYDIAVIGGGIAGAAIARDGAMRGLSVALFEKNTFGSGTSSKSSRLIHGGIRYLDIAWNAFRHGRFSEAWKNLYFVFTSLHESRILRRIAPDQVRPHLIFIPIYEGNRHRRFSVYLGCLVYYVFSLLSGGGKMPKFHWSGPTALQVAPGILPEGLKGGVTIRDHATDDLGLVKAVMASAVKNGANCHEHAEVIAYTYESGRYRLRVTIGGEEKEFLARKIINASGPWVDNVRKANKEKDKNLIVPVAGAHIWIKSFMPASVLLEAEDKRLFFVINFGERSRVGTTERLLTTHPDKVKATEDEVDYLLRSLKRWFPEHAMTKKDVLESDAGVRPLAAPPRTLPLNEISREHEVHVGPTGVIHMIGVKLTDHRRAAEEVLDRLIPSLLPFNPKAKRKTSTHKVPLI